MRRPGAPGRLVLALRYDTEPAARRDQDRPELAAWQAAADRHLTAPGRWYDCPVVHTMKDGDTGEAGFVRVVQGRLAATRAAEREMPVEMAVQLGTVRSYVEGLEEVELRAPLLVSPAVPVA